MVEVPENDVFYWLQSLDDPSLAFLCTVPWPFFPDYEPELPDMVFTANAALIYRRQAILAHFRFAERQGEEPHFAAWLRESGYRIPEGASRVLGSYIKQDMKFFVAKVNLKEQSKLGFSYLRPIQVAYESPKFMLPIRLGMVNAAGPQELFIFALTRKGRVETTNYRTVRLASDAEVPLFVKDDFSDFYRDMFTKQVKKEDQRALFLEYAWDMGWCDPCAADPLSREVRRLVAGNTLSALGTGFTLPFLLIYLTDVRGFEVETAGYVIATLIGTQDSTGSIPYGPPPGGATSGSQKPL